MDFFSKDINVITPPHIDVLGQDGMWPNKICKLDKPYYKILFANKVMLSIMPT